jgi:anti-sigma factor RsiW
VTEWRDGVWIDGPDVSIECEAMREHVEPYALGELDEPELGAFEAHLDGCPRCRASLAETERALAALPLALAHASSQRLPPALREQVMRRVLDQAEWDEQAERDKRAGQGNRLTSPPPAATRVPTETLAPPGGLASAPRPMRRTRLTWRTFAGMAAAAALALSLAYTAQLGVALARERAVRAELAQELAALSSQREIVLEVVDARDKTTRMLRPAAGAPREFATSYGKVYTRPDMPHVVAMTGRLPAPPLGQAYHLWVRLDGQTRLGGVLEINAEGFGQLVFQADRNGPVYESAWLTLQPPVPPSQTAAPQGPTLLRWDPN